MTRIKTALLLAACAALPLAAEEIAICRAAPERPQVDLVLCLDASNSMDALIASAKLKLWAIVSEMAKARPTPELRVALLSYGNNGYDKEKGWVRIDCPFTTDLDGLSAKLDAVTTNGGDEYVARVVREALLSLNWTPSSKALKVVFVAGNEPATQDPQFTLEKVFGDAIARGIQVNTLYCGAPTDPDAAGWRTAASRADGMFACIDKDRGTVALAAPQDKELAELSGKLNTTYLGYGVQGRLRKESQAAGDASAAKQAPSAAAERACSKSGGCYENSDWDMVDALQNKRMDLSVLKDEELPQEMRGLDAAGRQAYVERKAQERARIQEEIQKLSKDRESYLKEEMKKQGLSDEKSLDGAIRKAVKAQAEKKGMTFSE